MSDSTSQAPKAPTGSDISSILSQVQALQTDKERLLRELEQARQENGHLKQGKREEMKKVFDTVIARWLEDSVKDEEAKKQFTQGMERIMDSTHENGVWTVACAASNLHKSQLEEIERVSGWRTRVSGIRREAGSRTRPPASVGARTQRRTATTSGQGSRLTWGVFNKRE